MVFFCCDYNYSKLSVAFYQKQKTKQNKEKKNTYKPNKKDIYNHKKIYINFHKQKVKGLEQNSMQLFVKEPLTKRVVGVSSAL